MFLKEEEMLFNFFVFFFTRTVAGEFYFSRLGLQRKCCPFFSLHFCGECKEEENKKKKRKGPLRLMVPWAF